MNRWKEATYPWTFFTCPKLASLQEQTKDPNKVVVMKQTERINQMQIKIHKRLHPSLNILCLLILV